MRTVLRSLVLSLFVVVSVTGCALGETGVGRLAAYDLECPIEQLELTRDSAFEKTIRGCGREVTYVRSSGSSNPLSVPRGADGWRVRVNAD